MNVCHEGGTIVAFPDDWTARNEGDPDLRERSGPEWIDYCRARERAERAAAKRAASIDARRVHQELAQAYAQSAKQQRGERAWVPRG
jgi:hypothetical protein